MTSLDLKKVLKELLTVSAKWYYLGLELDLSSDTLDNIKTICQDNTERLRECLKIFLKQASPTPTWGILVKALAEPSVDYPQLAKELEEKYVEKSKAKTMMKISEGMQLYNIIKLCSYIRVYLYVYT